MNLTILLIIIGIFGALMSRTSALIARSGNMVNSSILLIVISFISNILFYSIIILAFMLFDWWITLIGLIVLSITVGMIASRRPLGLLISMQPFLHVIIIMLSSIAWTLYL